jgi:glycoprotein 6-alpha-L-fucosyltransferase
MEKYFCLKKILFYSRIHVRRTDKIGNEAAFHNLSEYMRYVGDYYMIYQYQNPNVNLTKRVYLATDEPTVFKEARTKYEELEIFFAKEFVFLY